VANIEPAQRTKDDAMETRLLKVPGVAARLTLSPPALLKIASSTPSTGPAASVCA
jgi:hypothetical protein